MRRPSSLLGMKKRMAIPSHGVLGPAPPHLLVAVAVGGAGRKGQIYHPVVGQTDLLPAAVVKRGGGGAAVLSGGSGLGEIGEIFRAVGEVALHRRCVAERETPAVVDEPRLADAGRCVLRLGAEGHEEEQYGKKACPGPSKGRECMAEESLPRTVGNLFLHCHHYTFLSFKFVGCGR